jgi:hypothetical protein
MCNSLDRFPKNLGTIPFNDHNQWTSKWQELRAEFYQPSAKTIGSLYPISTPLTSFRVKEIAANGVRNVKNNWQIG